MKTIKGIVILTAALLGCGESPSRESTSQVHTIASEKPKGNLVKLPDGEGDEGKPKYGFTESTETFEICEKPNLLVYLTMAEDIEEERGDSIFPTLFQSMFNPCHEIKSYRYEDESHMQVILKHDAESGWTVTTLDLNYLSGVLERVKTSQVIVDQESRGYDDLGKLNQIPEGEERLAWVKMLDYDETRSANYIETIDFYDFSYDLSKIK